MKVGSVDLGNLLYTESWGRHSSSELAAGNRGLLAKKAGDSHSSGRVLLILFLKQLSSSFFTPPFISSEASTTNKAYLMCLPSSLSSPGAGCWGEAGSPSFCISSDVGSDRDPLIQLIDWKLTKGPVAHCSAFLVWPLLHSRRAILDGFRFIHLGRGQPAQVRYSNRKLHSYAKPARSQFPQCREMPQMVEV